MTRCGLPVQTRLNKQHPSAFVHQNKKWQVKYPLLLHLEPYGMSKEVTDIIIIGTGNVSYHLTRVLLQAGLRISRVIARTSASARKFNRDLGVSTASSSWQPGQADLYILAVNDDSLKEAAANYNFNDHLVVHTSGSLPLDILKGSSANTGAPDR